MRLIDKLQSWLTAMRTRTSVSELEENSPSKTVTDVRRLPRSVDVPDLAEQDQLISATELQCSVLIKPHRSSDRHLVRKVAHNDSGLRFSRIKQPLIPRPHVARLAAGLQNRNWKQLQQTWLNLVAESENGGSAPDLEWFRQHLMMEWKRRSQLALANPNNPDHFAWPSIGAVFRGGQTPKGSFRSEGMLAYLGYHVGATNGLSTAARHYILDTVLTDTLPPVDSAEYVHSWGKPDTPARLLRLAQELARFIKNGKTRQSADLSMAVADWKEDLDYLHQRYYKKPSGFRPWPKELRN